MARPLFVKNSNASWAQASDYNINNGSWTRGKLIYVKTDNGWEHEHDYQDQVWLAAATCQNGTKYQDDCPCGEAHGAPYYSGPVDPDNHTGVEVYGGTENSHTQYNCCGLITSAIHNYETPNYTWSQTNNASTTSCIGTAICDCTYKKQKAATISINNYYAGTCLSQARWDYLANFNGETPFKNQVSPGYRYGDYDYGNHEGSQVSSYTSHGYETLQHTRYIYWSCCNNPVETIENESCSNYKYTIIQQPTCGDPGTTEVTCGLCGGRIEYDGWNPPPTGNHTEGNPDYEPVNPTSHKKTIKCTTCGETVSETYETHEFSVGTTFTACIHCGYVQ